LRASFSAASQRFLPSSETFLIELAGSGWKQLPEARDLLRPEDTARATERGERRGDGGRRQETECDVNSRIVRLSKVGPPPRLAIVICDNIAEEISEFFRRIIAITREEIRAR
jgi:hypothetical protein